MERETDGEAGPPGESYDLSRDRLDEDPSVMAECPSCGASIYEEAERCPRCGDYVTPGAPTPRPPRWIFWTAALSILVILVFWLGLPGSLWRAFTGR